jgi:hypothetical protein
VKNRDSLNKSMSWMGQILKGLRNKTDTLLSRLEKTVTVKIDDKRVGHITPRSPFFMPAEQKIADRKMDRDDVADRPNDEQERE